MCSPRMYEGELMSSGSGEEPAHRRPSVLVHQLLLEFGEGQLVNKRGNWHGR